MGDGESSSTTVAKFGWERIVTTLAAAPAVYGVVRIMLQAGGDWATFLALLSAANFLIIWIGAVLALSAVLVPVSAPLIVHSLFRRLGTSARSRSILRRIIQPLISVALGEALMWLMYGYDPVPASLMVIFSLFITFNLMVIGPVARGFRVLNVSVAVALVALALAFSFSTGLSMGEPPEFVEIRGDSQISVGYVVGTDDTALTLAYAYGGLRRVPIEDVGQRFICPDSVGPFAPQNSIYPGYMLLSRAIMGSGNQYVAPQCSTTRIDEVRLN